MATVWDEEVFDKEVKFYFMDFVKHCWKKKWQFIIPMAIASVLLIAFSIVSLKIEPEKSPLPNKYTSTAKLLVRETSSTSGISSSLSSLASLSGINLGMGADSSNGVLIATIAGTNSFKDAVIDEFDLVTRFKIKKYKRTNSRKKLDKVLSVTIDETSNVLSVSFTDIDPEFSQKVVTFAVNLLTERFYAVKYDDNAINLKNYQEAMDSSFQKIIQYQKDIQDFEKTVSNSSATSIPSIMFDVQMKKMELEAEESIYATFRGQHELLSIQMKDDPITLKLIQEPDIPDMKSSPSRGLICIAGVFAMFMICFVIVLLKYCLMLESASKATSKEESR